MPPFSQVSVAMCQSLNSCSIAYLPPLMVSIQELARLCTQPWIMKTVVLARFIFVPTLVSFSNSWMNRPMLLSTHQKVTSSLMGLTGVVIGFNNILSAKRSATKSINEAVELAVPSASQFGWFRAIIKKMTKILMVATRCTSSDGLRFLSHLHLGMSLYSSLLYMSEHVVKFIKQIRLWDIFLES